MECGICFENMEKEEYYPYRFPCKHIFCKKCVQQLIMRGELREINDNQFQSNWKCPNCRSETIDSKFIGNRPEPDHIEIECKCKSLGEDCSHKIIIPKWEYQGYNFYRKDDKVYDSSGTYIGTVWDEDEYGFPVSPSVEFFSESEIEWNNQLIERYQKNPENESVINEVKIYKWQCNTLQCKNFEFNGKNYLIFPNNDVYIKISPPKSTGDLYKVGTKINNEIKFSVDKIPQIQYWECDGKTYYVNENDDVYNRKGEYIGYRLNTQLVFY